MSQEDAPRAEDVECLAQLLRTVGAYLDPQPTRAPQGRHRQHQQQQPQSQQSVYMDAYFNRINGMIRGSKLESRHRFMLQVRDRSPCKPPVQHGQSMLAI